MNHIKKIALLFLGITLIFSSCKKDEKFNQTQSEDFYKEKLEKMFPQKEVSSINEGRKDPKTVLTFNSHAEAYEALSSLKKGVTFVNSVKAIRSSENIIKGDGRTNFGDDPIWVTENLSVGGEVSAGLKNTYHTVASFAKCNFTVGYTGQYGGYGWTPELLYVNASHSPFYITSGVGHVIGASGSQSWGGAHSTYDGFLVKIVGLNGTETILSVSVKLSVSFTSGYEPGSTWYVSFYMVTTS